MLFTKEWYLINCGTAGTALTDAGFLTALTGNSQERVWGGTSYGYPDIKCALGTDCLAAGAAAGPASSGVVLTGVGGGINANWDRWYFPIQWFAVGTTEFNAPFPISEPYDKHMLNMPYPNGATLVDASVSKAYAMVANSYLSFVLYQQAGPAPPAPQGGKLNKVVYDKGGDSTTVVWNTFENAAQNAAGELQKDHMYRLLCVSMEAQAHSDTEANMARFTVDGWPALTIPGAGGHFSTVGMSRRVYFMDDSIMLKGDAVHKVEGHIGTACRPTIHAWWEDFGPVQ